MSDITIRAVRPDDRERIVRAFQALDRRSVYLRFFSYRKALSEEELRRVTECDGVSEAVLVATVGSGSRETIVGVGGYVRTGAGADVAFAVEEDFQGRGVASRLLQQLAGIARLNGIERFEADDPPTGHVRDELRPRIRLVQRRFHHPEVDGVVVGEYHLERSDFASGDPCTPAPHRTVRVGIVRSPMRTAFSLTSDTIAPVMTST